MKDPSLEITLIHGCIMDIIDVCVKGKIVSNGVGGDFI
jgi:hypothetical protein